jgi:hypothetical protein
MTTKEILHLQGEVLLAQLKTARQYVDWEWRFRASALPVCQLEYVFYKLSERSGKIPQVVASYNSSFYTSIGTALHSSTQEWLGKLGFLHGNWACPCSLSVDKVRGCVQEKANKTDKDAKVCTCQYCVEEVTGTPECPTCKVPCTYEEYELKDEKGKVIGHCDGLLKFEQLSQFVLLELKTIGKDKLEKLTEPQYHYLMQIYTYFHLIKLRGLDLAGSLLVYLPREGPQHIGKFFSIPHTSKASLVYKTMETEHQVAVASMETLDFSGICGLCRNDEEAEGCCWRPICLGPNAKEYFQDLFKRAIGVDILDDKLPKFHS